MAYTRDRFRDPSAALATYDWEINHFQEDGADKRRTIERTAVTSGVGFVRQQGEDSPEVLRYKGTILSQTQYDKMVAYYEACRTRTIFFRDFTGDEKEVIITAFNPLRKWVANNPRGGTTNPGHIWTYDIEMEVVD